MLLRNLRRTLVSNKKYGLYALGEIILVVAGILIALQVDSWRESVANEQKATTYMSVIHNDLNDQLAEIEAQTREELAILRDSESLIKDFTPQNKFIINEQFSSSIGNINNWRTFIKIDPGYQQLLATGDIGLISNQNLKQEIFAYYHQLQKVEQIIDENHQYVQNSFLPLILTVSNHSLPNFQSTLYQRIVKLGYVPANVNEVLSNTKIAEDVIQEKVNKPDVKLELFNAIKLRYRIAAVHLSYLEDLKARTVRLKENIEL